MKKQLYRKVKISERLPKKKDDYITESTEYGVRQFRFGKSEDEFTDRFGHIVTNNIEYWLEPIEHTEPKRMDAEEFVNDWLYQNSMQSSTCFSFAELSGCVEDFAKSRSETPPKEGMSATDDVTTYFHKRYGIRMNDTADLKLQQFDSWDMMDFAEQFASNANVCPMCKGLKDDDGHSVCEDCGGVSF